MKKILVVHTRYKNRGGEDIAVDKEIENLNTKFEVQTLIFENSEKFYFMQLFYFLTNNNIRSIRMLKKKIVSFKPDIVYVHNTWFKGSLGIFKYLNKQNINTVLKLHNFRYFCTKTYFIRSHLNGHNFCRCCSISKDSNKLFNKYFQNSYLKSFLVNYYGKKYIKIIKHSNIKIIVLTKFHQKFLEKNNIRRNNVYVNANPLKLAKLLDVESKEKTVVYAGRISKEKGVEELINSFLNSRLDGFSLKIIGDGPQLKYLQQKYNSKYIEFTGELKNNDVLKIIAKSRAVVTNTKLYEGQPTILSEASLLGIPSIFPDTGGIAEFFPEKYSLKFEPFNDKELEEKLSTLDRAKLMETIGNKNQEFINKEFSINSVLNNFLRIVNE